MARRKNTAANQGSGKEEYFLLHHCDWAKFWYLTLRIDYFVNKRSVFL